MPAEMHKMQSDNDAAPVHDHPELPRMTDTAPAPRRLAGRIQTMATEPKADTGKRNRMAAFERARARAPRRDVPDQEPPRRRGQAGEEMTEGYVHLRLRVTDGDIAVVGAKAVAGPLVEGKLAGDLAYEVLLGDTRIAAGSDPDVGVRRSFPDPGATGEMQGHHITELHSYEVSVRVPTARVSSRTAMSRLEIVLYRIKDELPEPRIDRLPTGSVGAQFPRELREVARIKGIRPDRLNDTAADQVRRAFELD